MSRSRISNWVSQALLAFAPRTYRDAILGDLAEERAIRSVSNTAASASTWYWRQLVKSVVPLFWTSLLRGGWLGASLVSVCAYFGGALLESAVDYSVASVLGGGPHWLISVFIVVSTITLAAYCAARLRPRANVFLGFIILVDFAARLLWGSGAPTWYNATIFICAPMAVGAAGRLAIGRTRSAL